MLVKAWLFKNVSSLSIDAMLGSSFKEKTKIMILLFSISAQ